MSPVWLTHLISFPGGAKGVRTMSAMPIVAERDAPRGQPMGVPWVTARLAGQCHTTGPNKRAE